MIIRSPTTDCVETITRRLRPEDRQELTLSNGTVAKAVEASALVEVVATNSGIPVALWGLREDRNFPGVASIWMLCASDVEYYPTQFLRTCPALMARAHERYRNLLCAAWKGNDLHLRWLRWLGFTPMVGMEVPELIPHFHVLSTRNPTAHDGSERGRRLCPEAGE